MQHVIITATVDNVFWAPDPIQIYRDDQFIRFSVSPDTAWVGDTPIIFGPTWPGGPANPDVNNTYVANGNNPLPDGTSMQQYSVTFNVVHIPTGRPYSKDPEVDNQPQP